MVTLKNHADTIREYVLNQYVEPARKAGHKTISVTAGQIHSAMQLKDRLPAVCSAIGSRKFESACRVKVKPVPIPLNSSSTEFTIEV